MLPFFAQTTAFTYQFVGSMMHTSQKGNAPGMVLSSQTVPKWPGWTFKAMLRQLHVLKVSYTRVQ